MLLASWRPLLVLLASLSYSGVQAESAEHARLVTAIQEQLLCRCVFVVGGFRQVALVKQLNVSAAILTPHTLGSSSCMGLSFYLLLGGSTLTKETHEVFLRTAASSVWVLFSETEGLEDLFLGLDVPFNSQLFVARRSGPYIELWEVYRIEPSGPLHSRPCGTWSHGHLQWSTANMAQRRRDMHGLTLQVVSRVMPPYVSVENTTAGIKLGSLLGEVWQVLQAKMNFSSSHSMLSEGSTDDLIAFVSSGRSHVALGDFTITANRYKLTDFTTSVATSTSGVYLRPEGSQKILWHGFLKPFSSRLWLAVLGAVVLVVLHISLLHRHSHQTSECRQGVGDALLCAVGAFCLQGHSPAPMSHAARTALLVVHLTASTLVAAYSGALISHLTVRDLAIPFKDVNEFVLESSYCFAPLMGSSEMEFLQESTDPTIRLLALRLPADPVLEYKAAEGMTRLCSSRLAIFLPVDYVLATTKRVPCDLVTLPGLEYSRGLYIPVAKDSPYRWLIDYNLHLMRESGVFRKLRAAGRTETLPPVVDPLTSVDLVEIAPLLAALGAGCALSVLILLLECSVSHWRERQRAKKHLIAM